jgi:hypothetical protein
VIILEYNPKILGTQTPAEWKADFERLGFEVKPLGRGKHDGISFEYGGGFRISYDGDSYFQYHPKDGSHHEGAYYKMSDGIRGIRRFDLNGVEKHD